MITLIGACVPFFLAKPSNVVRSDGTLVTVERQPTWKTEFVGLYKILATGEYFMPYISESGRCGVSSLTRHLPLACSPRPLGVPPLPVLPLVELVLRLSVVGFYSHANLLVFVPRLTSLACSHFQ